MKKLFLSLVLSVLALCAYAEVHQGTVVYGSAWEVPGGTIELSIEKSTGVYGGMVIKYRDSQNIEAKIRRVLEDI